MAKRASFHPRKAEGRVSKWVVNVPPSHSSTGKRERHFFENKDVAETFCEQTRTKIRNYGTQASLLTPAKTELALQAFEKLKPFGVDLNTVVEEWIARKKQAQCSCSFETLLDEFAAAGRHGRGRSVGYRRSILQVRARLTRLHGELVSEISQGEVHQALEGMKPSVRNFTVRILTCAFNVAIARGYLVDSPMKNVEHAAAPSREIDLYSPAEVASILHAAEQLDPSLIPFLAISFFAGVRRSEVLRMNWSHVELEERYIRLPKLITKTQQGRHVPIEENLLNWLMPHAQKSGAIVPYTANILRSRERALRKSHGVRAIKHGPRHAYGSFWLAAHENIDRLMLSMGHTDFETTREHYAKVVSLKSARLFWAIAPAKDAANKVVSMANAA